MNVIGMTVFVGLVLVGLFVYLFWHQARGSGGPVSDRDALMPLEEDDGVAPADRRGPGR
ncbi:MAG: hypothetical protein IT577_13805 [Verrucomicrobiae bacterium]|nr:hypothetical protein [Verrucomicrobiae bacterium]